MKNSLWYLFNWRFSRKVKGLAFRDTSPAVLRLLNLKITLCSIKSSFTSSHMICQHSEHLLGMTLSYRITLYLSICQRDRAGVGSVFGESDHLLTLSSSVVDSEGGKIKTRWIVEVWSEFRNRNRVWSAAFLLLSCSQPSCFLLGMLLMGVAHAVITVKGTHLASHGTLSESRVLGKLWAVFFIEVRRSRLHAVVGHTNMFLELVILFASWIQNTNI